MSDNIAIKVENVSKTFKLPHERNTSIKSAVVNFYHRKRTFEKQQVLNDVSFEVKKGEFFGIVGRNGSGKSTLLKMLAGIYTPSKGYITVNGKLTPFIELGVGFSPELTGHENVFLNGALLGFSRKEMDILYDEIVDFAEIGRFMDQKLKNYSSGMQVRLAFSIAIRTKSDILLIDEVLAVGDLAFQQKCFEYFDQLKEKKKTIVLVTHDMTAVNQFCDRALFIHDGHIEAMGDPKQISQKYERVNYANSNDGAKTSDAEQELLTVDIIDRDGNAKQKIEYGGSIQFALSWPKDKEVGQAGVVIFKSGEVVFAANTRDQECNLGEGKIVWKVNALLGAGRYKVAATIFKSNRKSIISTSKLQSFLIYDQPLRGKKNDEWEGVSYLENEWLQSER